MSAYDRLRPLLFRLDPERAHRLTLRTLALAGGLPPVRAALRRAFCPHTPGPRVHAFGLEFPNPVGLAAGYDKDGSAAQGLACLGFGHLELGTVTPLAQPGNPHPRLFRLPDDRALINRMGFPNAGAQVLLQRLRSSRPAGVVIGVNLSKGRDTPLDRAADDYVALLRLFAGWADYLAVNVSSPNTVGLRELQGRRWLGGLLRALAEARAEAPGNAGRVPILVKLSPDLTDRELAEAVGVIEAAGMDGIIATNTTLARPGLRSPLGPESGGLSGAPLRERATAVVHRIRELTGGSLPIVAAGGIFSPEQAREKLEAGAVLVQLYTGLVYCGPGIVRRIVEGLGV